MKLTLARLEVLIWALIYGGLLVLALGLALRSVDAALAGSVSVAGGIGAAVGVFLIWVRARRVRSAALQATDSSSAPT